MILFAILAALTVAGGLAAVMLRSIVHCVLALVVAFIGLALLFLRLHAQFAGFAQILVYVGAVAILAVFAILLTGNSETPKTGVFSGTWLSGLVVAAAVFSVLAWAVLNSQAALPHEQAASQVSVEQIGHALMSSYVLQLQIVAVLLTVAMIGAVIVAMYEKGGAK